MNLDDASALVDGRSSLNVRGGTSTINLYSPMGRIFPKERSD